MKNLLLFLSFCALSSYNAQTNNTINISVGGTSRSYKLYVPAIYNANNPVPLVFNFHGYGSNNTEQEAYGEFRPIADTANFIIAHPQGLVVNGSAGWNNFGSVAAAQADLNFVQAMITKISSDYNINSNRIYSTGMSNGGFMSYDNACFLSSKFAAIASVTGGMLPAHKNACQPTHPIPVMQIHGTADAVVAYGGSPSIGSISVDSLVKFWRTFNQCNPVATYTALPNISVSDNCTAEHFVYSGGLNGSTVEFYKITGGGHTWPGAIYPANGNTNMDFSASKEIWRFFSKYKLNELTASLPTESMQIEVKVYPNPSQGTFSIELENFEGMEIQLLDVSGKILHQQTLVAKINTISVPTQKAGFYLYRIVKGIEVLKTGKVNIM